MIFQLNYSQIFKISELLQCISKTSVVEEKLWRRDCVLMVNGSQNRAQRLFAPVNQRSLLLAAPLFQCVISLLSAHTASLECLMKVCNEICGFGAVSGTMMHSGSRCNVTWPPFLYYGHHSQPSCKLSISVVLGCALFILGGGVFSLALKKKRIAVLRVALH